MDDSTIVFLVSGQATQSGDLYNPANDIAKHSTGKLYTSLPVRKWDSYVTENRNALFFGSLQNINGKYCLAPNSLKYAFQALPGVECPIPPFGDSSQYDISKTGVVFISKDPMLNRYAAPSPASHVYFIPLATFSTGGGNGGSDGETVPQKIIISDLHGASSSPVFAPGGKSVAFLKMKEAGYESDKNRIILVPDISRPETSIEILASEDGRGAWDRSPSSITWSDDGKELFATAEERGRAKLFKVSLEAKGLPVAVTEEGCVSSVKASLGLRLGDETRLFITSSTFTEPCRYTIVDPSLRSPPKILYSSPLSTISSFQVSEIWYPSVGGELIHTFIVTPKDFDPSAAGKYPIVFLIHGGPQYAWRDDFPVEGIYNPLLFAAQGYVVFLPNITGSTGYGQPFTDSIRGEWGGKPYLDLENGFNYVKDNLPYADIERAVALGGSWGGYMANWLAGQLLGKQFKALVSDSGIFSTQTFASATDEGWFPKYEFEGHWWAEGKRVIAKWDPSGFVSHWITPMLIIHNEKDFRHPITEGVAAFNVLQERGIESAFLTFEDEGHMTVLPENMLVLYREVFRFLNRFVGIDGGSVD